MRASALINGQRRWTLEGEAVNANRLETRGRINIRLTIDGSAVQGLLSGLSDDDGRYARRGGRQCQPSGGAARDSRSYQHKTHHRRPRIPRVARPSLSCRTRHIGLRHRARRRSGTTCRVDSVETSLPLSTSGPSPSPAQSFSVRAERAGNGGGRVYTVTYTATDRSNNSSAEVREVTVPHDQSSSWVAGPTARA